MPLYCNCTCISSSTLRNSNIFGSLISSSTQLSNSLDRKPGAIDLILKGCYCITLNVENSSGKDLFLERLRIVGCVGNEDGLLRSF